MTNSLLDKQYNRLHALSREARVLSGVSMILHWDQETYLPIEAHEIRSDQLSTLAEITHAKKTGQPFASALDKLIDIKTGEIRDGRLSPNQCAALREWRRDYLLEKALPKKFVREFAKLTSQAMIVWRDAREKDAFNEFAPYLERIIALLRRKADLIGYVFHPYDALLDIHEPGATTLQIAHLFDELKDFLCPFLKKIHPHFKRDGSSLYGTYSPEKQQEFSLKILKIIGYEMGKGRLDYSTHPFSTNVHPTDSRITSRIDPKNIMNNISSVLHEAGHSMYEMGLPSEQYGTPLGDAISFGMHESQSRWWEIYIGQSKSFWQYCLPLLQKEFEGLKNFTLDKFYKAINQVEPTFIRVDADEVTYNMHIILRFELERSLIEGTLKVKEIPQAWNAKMQELLEIVPKNDREGCLQDIHWSMGEFGYFPTYTLGNLYAAQLFEKFEKDHSNWDKRVANGKFAFIKDWLSKSVYQYGRRYRSHELLELITGKIFSAKPFIDYLKVKYQN